MVLTQSPQSKWIVPSPRQRIGLQHWIAEIISRKFIHISCQRLCQCQVDGISCYLTRMRTTSIGVSLYKKEKKKNLNMWLQNRTLGHFEHLIANNLHEFCHLMTPLLWNEVKQQGLPTDQRAQLPVFHSAIYSFALQGNSKLARMVPFGGIFTESKLFEYPNTKKRHCQ